MPQGSGARPNIVLICVDEWRGDCLSAAGHELVQTPYLDELAGDGVRFSRGYSATPTCVPARVALFTGQSQERHGRVGYTDGVPFERLHPVTLPGELRRGGYQTQAIGKMHVFPERSRIGFDDVRLHDGFLHFARNEHQRQFEFFDDYVPWLRRQPGSTADTDYFDHGLNCNSVVARPWEGPERWHPTSWVGTETVDWLYRRDPTRPFFLYLSFHRPHPPYDPPAWAFEQHLGLPAWAPKPDNWRHHYDYARTDGAHDAFVASLDSRMVHRARAGYYGHMAHIDQQVNRIRESLADFGLADNTYFCFVSDHGEMLGDHDMFRKGFGFEGSAHIPFLLAGPKLRNDHVTGRVVDHVVELRDVMPTLLDLAGLEIPDSCDGVSLAPFLRGEDPPGPRPWLHGEHTMLGQSLQWVTDGRVKYLWGSAAGAEELFSLTTDPSESTNLAEDPGSHEPLTLWRGRLIEALADREEGYVVEGRLVPGRQPRLILDHARERLPEGHRYR